jgi:hypothetical protein
LQEVALGAAHATTSNAVPIGTAVAGTNHAFMVRILCSPFETAGNAEGKAMS